MELLLLADADVLIHFFRGNLLHLLPDILPQKIALIDVVATEIDRGYKPTLYQKLMKIIGSRIVEIKLSDDDRAFNEWLGMIAEGKDEGESACLALAKYNGHYVASSNLKDILPYCEEKRIRVYTTMDLLYAAYEAGRVTRDECNSFVHDVITGGSRLPCKTFDEYLQKFKKKNPWNSFDTAYANQRRFR